MFVYPVCTLCNSWYKKVQDAKRSDWVTLSVDQSGVTSSSSTSLVGCCRESAGVAGPGMEGAGLVGSPGASDGLRGQMLVKVLQSAPQCCSHCPRSRCPTQDLILSPHFSRKFISSTYGLLGIYSQRKRSKTILPPQKAIMLSKEKIQQNKKAGNHFWQELSVTLYMKGCA